MELFEHQSFKQVLLEDIQLAIQLDTLLQQEKAALLENNPLQLQSLLQEKIEKLILLETHHHQRMLLLQKVGLPLSIEGVNQYIVQVIPGVWQSELRELWQTLQTHVNACQMQNTNNGRIISANLQASQRLRQLLFAASGDGPAETYSQTGKTHVTATAHPIDRA